MYIYKRLGETPLQALNRLRKEDPTLSEATLSYAGRLDPLAEGIMLVLVNEENNHREEYLSLLKEYELEILCGISTDSYDLLGLITDYTKKPLSLREEDIASLIPTFKGIRTQPYPPYSSKTVSGKPLFQWAREGKIGDIGVPTKEITIHEIEFLGLEHKTKDMLEKDIIEKISLVTGDFRQEEITSSWRSFFKHNALVTYPIIRIRALGSSGTYMRSLSVDIGTSLGIPALAYSIKRTAYKK